MYKIFKDKDRIFKCNVDVQGADIKDCKAMLVFESIRVIKAYPIFD